jgi:hypothetical protein
VVAHPDRDLHVSGSLDSGLGNCDAAMAEANKSITAAGEDHFVRALLIGNVATVAALCGRNEEALGTLERLAREPVSFVHLGQPTLRAGIQCPPDRAAFPKADGNSKAALKKQSSP